MKKYNFIIITILTCIFSACNSPQTAENSGNNLATPSNQQETSHDENYTKGEIIFNQYCVSCHNIHKMLVGPALKGVPQKYANDKKWLYEYIRNNQKLIKEGDKKAISLYNENGRKQMLEFPFLKDADIDAILHYIELYQPQE